MAADEVLSKESPGLLEAAYRVLRLAAADGGSANNEGAIRDGFGDRFEFFGAGEQWLSTNGGTRFAKGRFVGIHDAQMEEAEVTHGASGSTDVERIARLDEDNAQEVGFGVRRQGSESTAEEKR